MKKRIGLIILALAVAGVSCAVTVLGQVHIVNGLGFKHPRIIRKDRFGFKETYIDLNRVTDKPWSVVERTFPVSLHALTRHRIIWPTERPPTPPAP